MSEIMGSCFRVQKECNFKLILLDEREFKFCYKFNKKCEQFLVDTAKIINLQEKDYFGFRFVDSDLQTKWIDLNKTIYSQFKSVIKSSGGGVSGDGEKSENQEDGTEHKKNIDIRFAVKFYATDPCKLQYELTRYLFYLQLRNDLLNGRLICTSFEQASHLFAYFLQDEIGDYDDYNYTSTATTSNSIASNYEFMPMQSNDLEKAAEARHAKLTGMSQPDAESAFFGQSQVARHVRGRFAQSARST